MDSNARFMVASVGLLVFVLLATAVPARADRIITISTVTNRVKLRHRPGMEAPAVGSLRRGESAELIESVPYWYHIRLNNGVPGYVSRAWTRKVSEAEADGELIRLGSWKLRKLGQITSTDFELLAQIIDAHFDVLAVVEVMQEEGGHPGYDSLLSALGPGWAGMITESPRPNTTERDAEFCAILYRTALVCPCEGWKQLMYYSDSEGAEVVSGPDDFSREPAFACFKAPMNKSSAGVDFLLGAYHARRSDEGISEIKKEADHIDDVFQAMLAARPGERDIIIAGTFNLSPQDLQNVLDIRVRSLGSGSVLSWDGELTADLHDHMLILDEQMTNEMIDAPQVIDVRSAASSNREFYEKCSDHLPVLLRLRASGPDDDS